MKINSMLVIGICAASLCGARTFARDAVSTAPASDYSQRSEDPNADNTRKNVRDRDNDTQTPVKQGNSKEDIMRSADIRKEVIANHSLSTDAHNVKIVTNEGKVTLRGPVKSDEEKRAVLEAAEKVAGRENVNCQLEVK